jgi:ABC-type nitrate/sulfonate/bicarbonate transport system substrate-binding protein
MARGYLGDHLKSRRSGERCVNTACRNNVYRLGAALLLSAAVFALGGRMASAQQLTPMKVGISDPVNTVLAMWMASSAGFYKAQGIDAEIKSTDGGSRGAAMIQSGDIQVMHVGLSSVVKINRGGGDIRLIGSLSNVIRFTFFAAPGVKTPADLKGGVVAVSSFGSESDATVTMALKKLGMTRADVEPKEFGGGRARIAALNSGAAKATSVNEPTATQAREAGVTVLTDLVPDRIPWLFSGIVVKTSYLAANRDLLSRFLKATIEGNYLALSDEKRAKEVIAKELKLTDPKIIDITYNDFKAQTPPNTEPTKESIDNILAQAGDGSRKGDDYVDTSLLDGLKKDGFFAAMEKKYGKF